jgi:CheY-like chemotaxis protein
MVSRILIVDDAVNSREALAKLLRSKGHETDTAKNGAEGLVRLKQHTPDLVLLDQMMPEVDGLTFLTGIRRFPRWKNLPVLLLTGVSDRTCLLRAQQLGVKDCLQKGEYTVPQLVQQIEKHVKPEPKPEPVTA